MQLKTFLILCLGLFASVSFAQKKSLTPEGSIQAGLLEGEQGSALQLGFTGGVNFKTWSAALGTGLDYYGVRSIPLYLQVQKKILDRSQTPFVYAGGGYHFPWVPQNTKEYWGESNANGGLYYHAGIGYQLPAFKKAALFFAAGYSFKQYMEEITEPVFCIWAPCPEYKQKFDYRLRRLSIATGLRF